MKYFFVILAVIINTGVIAFANTKLNKTSHRLVYGDLVDFGQRDAQTRSIILGKTDPSRRGTTNRIRFSTDDIALACDIDFVRKNESHLWDRISSITQEQRMFLERQFEVVAESLEDTPGGAGTSKKRATLVLKSPGGNHLRIECFATSSDINKMRTFNLNGSFLESVLNQQLASQSSNPNLVIQDGYSSVPSIEFLRPTPVIELSSPIIPVKPARITGVG